MAEIILHPICKVNLSLSITGRRADGFHELRTLFFPLRNPSDRIIIWPAKPGTGLDLRCDHPDLTGKDNLIHRIYNLFSRYTNLKPDLHVLLEKNIPVGAGLGGGSSDAAFFLKALNNITGGFLSGKILSELAISLGSDVPFFLYGQPAWACGRGEKILPTDTALPGLSLILACPDCAVSTAWAYAAWDTRQKKTNPHDQDLTDQPGYTMESKFYSPESSQLGLCLFNSLEQAVFPSYPTLRLLKERFLRLGASGALMTGSGSAVFALFRDKNLAERAVEDLTSTTNKVFVNEF